MKRSALAYVVALCALASKIAAEPCVSETFELPLPEATSVVSHVSDVPSVLFPAFWQEGILQGFKYKIFASAVGTVRSTDIREDWVISITCDPFETSCVLSTDGEPPQSAVTVSNKIGECLLGTEVADEKVTDATPDIQSPESANVEPSQDTPQTEAAACGSASIDEVNEIAVMQRLLVLAGEDPGPVDGLVGPRTFSAMEPFVAGADQNTSIPDVISLLDARLCANAD